MINFFRKIRKKMADDNKPLKYMRYAIGEIVLVVIGILIALSINNWNEDRKEKELGLLYLSEMTAEIQEDLSFLDFILNKLEKIIINQEAALKSKNLNVLSLDSLKMTINNQNIAFNVKQATYDKMINLGLTNLSKEGSLNNEIARYYNVKIPFFNSIKGYNTQYLFKDFDFMLYQQNGIDIESDFSKIEFPSLYDEDIEKEKENQKKHIIEFIQSIQGRNIVLRNFKDKKAIKQKLTNFRKVSADLLSLIYVELVKNETQLEFILEIPDEFDITEMQLTTTQLNKYVGRYELSPELSISITLEDSKLYGEPTGIEKVQFTPYNEKYFRIEETENKVYFNIINGEVISLTGNLKNEKNTLFKVE